MNDEFIGKMKTKLEQEQTELQKELDSVSSSDKGDHVPGDRDAKFPNYGDDNLDENTESPAEVAQYMENVNATGVLESKQKDVLAALKRIEDGTYATCISCGGEIAQERLEAEPSAGKCIACAKSHTAA